MFDLVFGEKQLIQKKKLYIFLCGLFVVAFLATPALVKLSTKDSKVYWKIVPARTNISFTVKHFVLMKVEGKFKNAEGTVVTVSDGNFSNAEVEAQIPVHTIYTGNLDRDEHLKQDDFFNADQFPVMLFKSRKVLKKSEGVYEMHGDLTIREVNKPIVLTVTHSGERVSNDGTVRSKFIAKGVINRYDYGLTWNELTEAGSMVVGKHVNIILDVTLEKSEMTLARE
jgi:polyisoprenoid-binding protein YceI